MVYNTNNKIFTYKIQQIKSKISISVGYTTIKVFIPEEALRLLNHIGIDRYNVLNNPHEYLRHTVQLNN